MQEAYGRVIDLVANDAIDFRAIGLSLAKARPDVFLALHDLAANPVMDQRVAMDNEIRKLYAIGQKVAAIKFCREQTGWGLKEASSVARSSAALTLVGRMSLLSQSQLCPAKHLKGERSDISNYWFGYRNNRAGAVEGPQDHRGLFHDLRSGEPNAARQLDAAN